MIVVTRLNGPQFAVNPDLIQRIETTPDTILTLIDGTKYVVAESLAEVTERIVTYRASVVARTMESRRGGPGRRHHDGGGDAAAPGVRPRGARARPGGG